MSQKIAKLCISCGKEFPGLGRKCAACIKREYRARKAEADSQEAQPASISEGLDSVLTMITKKFDDPEKQKNYEGFLAQLPKTEWVSTGTGLDKLTRLPKDKMTLVFGHYGVGKSTLAHLVAARSGLKTLYIDTEAGLNPERLVELGIDSSKFDIRRETLAEDISNLLLDEKTLQKYDLIIWDSIGSTTCMVEESADPTEQMNPPLVRAKIINRIMRLLPTRLAKHRTTVLLINQEMTKVDGLRPTPYPPGGKLQSFMSSVVIRFMGTYPKIKAEVTKSRFTDVGKLEFNLEDRI